MQVTTGNSSARTHLLFKIACLVGGIIAFATLFLIWGYRSMELSDLRDHDSDVHARLIAALIGTNAKPGELLAAANSIEASYIMSRTLNGVLDSSAHVSCSLDGADGKGEFLARGGPLIVPSKYFSSKDLVEPRPKESFSMSSGTLWHLTSTPWKSTKISDTCRLDLYTDLSDETRRISARSYQIALSSAILEGLLLLSLLWIARRGDERLIESEKEQKAMESELFFLSHYDTLTHLPNRSLFWERLDAAISRADRLGKSVCLVLVDLRDFTKINDTHGRTIGDKTLVEAARRIQAAARSADLVCRLGSDEFAVLLEDLDPERAVDAAQRLSASLAKHFMEPWAESCPDQVLCNCGAAMFPHNGANSEDILATAQNASKNAKDKNKLLLFAVR